MLFALILFAKLQIRFMLAERLTFMLKYFIEISKNVQVIYSNCRNKILLNNND